MIIYFIILSILIILWLLFVYNLHISIFFSLDSLRVNIFKLPLINYKNEKYIKFLSKFIPTSTKQVQEEIDLSSLVALIHFDVIEIKVDISTYDYPRIVLINTLINIILSMYKDKLINNGTKYTYLVEKNDNSDLNGVIKCNFNIGVILINYLIIKRRYRYEKTN